MELLTAPSGPWAGGREESAGLGYHLYLLLVSVDVDQVEGEDVVLGPHQQPAPLLVQQEGVVAGAVGHAVKGDQVTGVQHFWGGERK